MSDAVDLGISILPPADEPGALASASPVDAMALSEAERSLIECLRSAKPTRVFYAAVQGVLDAAERLDAALAAEQRARAAAVAALAPFARRADDYDRDDAVCGRYPDVVPLELEHSGSPGHLTVGDLRRARAAAPSPPAPVVASADPARTVIAKSLYAAFCQGKGSPQERTSTWDATTETARDYWLRAADTAIHAIDWEERVAAPVAVASARDGASVALREAELALDHDLGETCEAADRVEEARARWRATFGTDTNKKGTG